VWKDASVTMMMHLERPASGGWFGGWQPATPWLRFTGPGRIAVNSAYERSEGSGRIVSTSQSTSVDWNQQRMSMQVSAVKEAMANSVDDKAFEAALDAFAAANGFAAGKDSNRGVTKAHEYTHPGGINIKCTVVDTSVATAALSQISGVLGSRLSKFAGRLDGIVGNMAAKGSSGGQPVEAVAGSPATWNQRSEWDSVLTVAKNQRSLMVEVSAQIPGPDQLAWLRAWAAAGLPAV
jgi:hypothetical protein